jgi:assimilatory nitrate reductase catalytic subunit
MQCGMLIDGALKAAGDHSFPVNQGRLCVKGWTATELLNHQERLLQPLARNSRGQLEPVSREEALGRVVDAFRRSQERGGRDAVGVLSGGSLTNEKAYLAGKFARVALGTSNIDYNGRFCMSSAAAAQIKAFGLDRGLPFPLSDIPQAEVILLVGSNLAETMPPVMEYFDEQLANGGRLIVVDPRLSTTAQAASLHLQIKPGADAALANGLLHILIRDGLIDRNYIAARTECFESVRSVAAAYWPDRVERITNVPAAQLELAAGMMGRARSAMILTARGTEQQAQGVNNVLAFINTALALGLPGKPFSGCGAITGQGNGQGGREHGQKADQLPGYRAIDDPQARRHTAQVWRIDEGELPTAGKSAYEMIETFGQPGGVSALLTMGFNFAVSAPDSGRVIERVRSLDFLVVADFFLSETAKMADVALPAAQWAEEEGTMTNLEGRVIRRRRVIDPPPEVLSDWQWLCEIADRLGKRKYFAYTDEREIFEELRQATKGGHADYSGISYRKIDENDGVFWPCPGEDHPGTPRLFSEKFYTANGRARFHAVQHQAPREEADEEFPLYLTTGRLLAHYQSGTQTRRVEKLQALASEPFAEMHPRLARRYSLSDGEEVTLASRRGSARFKVKITPGIREDTIFAPFHWGDEQAVNRLTNPALDPVSRMPEFKVCAVKIISD